jgi:GTP cyclohydrolase II
MTRIEAPLALDQATLVLGQRRIVSVHGAFDVTFFRDQPHDRTTMAISLGDLTERRPLLARVHSSCLTSECLMATDCDCAEQLEGALARIAEAGRGVVFYLMQEGRGAGLTAKARDRMLVQASGHRMTTFDAYAEMGLPADLRDYDRVGPMARALAIRGPVELLTNNPDKVDGVMAALAHEKIDVATTRTIEGPTSPYNRDYLRAKRQSGHLLVHDGSSASILPPDALGVEPAQPATGQAHLVSTALYFLPVGLSDEASSASTIDWFRMRVVYDRSSGRESVLLWMGDDFESGESASSGRTLTLIDRLPCREARGRAALRRTLESIRDRGVGRVVVHFDDENPEADLDLRDRDDPRSERTRAILAARWASDDVEADDAAG